MNYDAHPYMIYRKGQGCVWYEQANKGCSVEAESADAALLAYVSQRTNASGDYLILSVKTGMLIHMTVRPNQAYVVERS